MTFIAAAIIGAVATAGATAYSSKQARKAQKRAREDQQLRDLIEGAAPNISAVERVIDLSASSRGSPYEAALAA